MFAYPDSAIFCTSVFQRSLKKLFTFEQGKSFLQHTTDRDDTLGLKLCIGILL